MGDSLFFALTNNRLFRCTPCGVIGFSAYRSVGAQADSVVLPFFGLRITALTVFLLLTLSVLEEAPTVYRIS